MRRPSTRALLVTGVLVALLLAGVVSYYASSAPDGLNRVAQDQGFAGTQRPHASDDSPLAGYSTRGVRNERLSGGLAGVAGSLVVLVLAGGLTLVVRRRGTRPRDDRQDSTHQAGV
jgi:cobalt/nickel transport protein